MDLALKEYLQSLNEHKYEWRCFSNAILCSPKYDNCNGKIHCFERKTLCSSLFILFQYRISSTSQDRRYISIDNA